MTGAKRDPGTSANFRYTTSTDMTARRTSATQLPASWTTRFPSQLLSQKCVMNGV